MSDCLFADLDVYWKTAATTDMGLASAYTTLRLPTVIIVGDLAQINEQKATLPLLAVGCLEPQYTSGEHAGGSMVVDTTYQYRFTAITSVDVPGTPPTQAQLETAFLQAKVDAQELLRRMRAMVRGRFACGELAAADGERVYRTRLKSGLVNVFLLAGGKYYAMAQLDVDVLSKIV